MKYSKREGGTQTEERWDRAMKAKNSNTGKPREICKNSDAARRSENNAKKNLHNIPRRGATATLNF